MKAIQLELDFRSAIAQALAEPEVADLRMLWRSLEPELLGLTEKEQLQQGTSLSVVKLWMDALLGGLEMRQSGGFYEAVGVAIAWR